MIRYTPLALTCSLIASVSLRCSCLHKAARQGNVKQVKAFVQSGADVNLREVEYPNHTPLSAALSGMQRNLSQRIFDLATGKNHIAVVKALLDADADPNTPFGKKKITPLTLAARNGSVDAVQLLLEVGAISQDGNNTALHEAVLLGNTSIVQMLLDAGAPLNTISVNQNIIEWLPIHAAASTGRADIMRMLICAGSELDTLCGGDKTPLDFALAAADHKRDEGALRELLNHGAALLGVDQANLKIRNALLANPKIRNILRANAHLAHQWAWTVHETLSLTSTDTGERLPADLIRLIMSFATNNAEPREPNLPRDQLTRMRYSYTDTVSVSCAALLAALTLTAAIIALP